MTLEERIKALMEAKQEDELLSEESLEEAKVKMSKEGDIEVDSDDKDSDEDEKDPDEDGDDDSSEEGDTDDDNGDTDVSKDSGKKDKVEVKEGTDPFGKLSANGAEESGKVKDAKSKAKIVNKDAAPGKIAAPTGSIPDGQADADNKKIKSGMEGKDTGGKVSDGVTGSETSEPNAKNAVDKNPVGVKEHMDALFNGEELSEEFQAKAATIFEAAVESAAQARIDALTEEYAQKVVALQEEVQAQLDEAVEEVRSELVDNIDGFMTEMVKEWMSDNQVAIESGMKVEMVSSFIDGLKNLFSEHYVDVPEEKLDVVAEQAQELEELAQISNTLVEENEALQAELASLKSALVFESVCEDLTDVQVEKFKGLVENVEFSTVEDYQDKLETLKEAYFPMGQTTETKLTEDTAQGVDESMSKYVAAVSKNLKF